VEAARPQVIYTHNLADKHDTHVAVVLRTLQALRELPREARPEHVYGCEVWRDLDWLSDADKVVFDVQAHENLAMSLVRRLRFADLWRQALRPGHRWGAAAPTPLTWHPTRWIKPALQALRWTLRPSWKMRNWIPRISFWDLLIGSEAMFARAWPSWGSASNGPGSAAL
jgi:hypothetical protein